MVVKNRFEEEWRDIAGWEDEYRISSFGRVYSVKSKRFIALRLHNKGYQTLSLWRIVNGVKYREQKYVHRLVAESFIDNPNKYPCVNHLDNDCSNNRLDNLEWCTFKQNTAHAKRQNRLITPIDMGYRKHKQPYRVELLDGTCIGDFKSLGDAMIAIGENPLNHTPINNVKSGKLYKGKYKFIKLPRIRNSVVC